MARKKPILVVDDDPRLRTALGRILRNEGHDVLEASDGRTAVEMSTAHDPSLVLVDYMMPGMDGEMVLEELHKTMRDDAPPAVVFTGATAQQDRARKSGAELALQKPFKVEELLSAVARYKRNYEPDA